QGRVRKAYLFLIGAGVFDKFDGSVARRLGLTDPLPGEEEPRRVTLGGVLDDIADAVSFCIAPAWIFYITMTNCSDPALLKLPIGFAALFYAILGFIRLIYFTVDKNPIPGFFKGIPTPAAAFFALAPLVMFSQAANTGLESARFWGFLSFGMMIFLGFLMNFYPIRYLHLGRFAGRHPWFGRASLLVLVSLFTPYFGLICFSYMFLYMLSPLITSRIDPAVAARETKNKPADPADPADPGGAG
ncbi:MAG: CDP-alcohol phosphatidyltransferase, partial [Desulfobacterales bacterium]|nr:CDP-alcohol phosphatidyltransferase [Desulfobacterales bacterium]